MTEEQAATEWQRIPVEQFAEEESTVPTEQPVTKEEPVAEEKTATAGELREQTTRLTEHVAEQASRFPFFAPFAELNAVWWSGARQRAAWFIETSEKLAQRVLEFQEQATGWAKDTPWAPLFDSSCAVARRWVEGSADMARRLWQLEEKEVDTQKKVGGEAR